MVGGPYTLPASAKSIARLGQTPLDATEPGSQFNLDAIRGMRENVGPQRDSFCDVADSSDVGIFLMQKSGTHVRSWQVVLSLFASQGIIFLSCRRGDEILM